MRRALAAAVLGISLWLGSVAWTGFVLLHTVLDPGRSEAVAESLYEDEAVRAQLAENIADGVEAALPPAVPVERGTVESLSASALDSPAVEAVFIASFVRTHQAFLGEGDLPRAVDGGAFGSAARDTLVEQHPALDAVLPAAPELAVPLPTERVPDAGPVRHGLQAAVPLLAGVAVAGIALALLVTSNRPAVVRRAGIWAMGLSATVLVVAYGIPALADRYASGQSAVIGALVRAMAETTRLPALTLCGLGVVAVVASLLWRHAPVAAVRPAPAPAPRVRTPRSGRRLGTSTGQVAMPRGPRTPRTRLPDGYAPGARQAEPAPPDRTRVVPRPEAPTVVQRPGEDPTRVEGAIPPDARWVPGVGYVVDDL
ncbi:MAG TPA: hypothetical protein VFV42_11840 [Acidimicrobiales bacterium]|nr:hypothetical protein [Acidimicrobiales bacterium]